ncbi:MAG: VOC family protein [Acidimicrobiia bacterium]
MAHETRWLFHSTAMVADYDRAISSLARLGGLRVLEYSEQQVPEVGRRGGMTWIGDNSIEIGQPIVEGAGADKFVRRNGGGVHSIALQVSDLQATTEHVQSLGVAIAARPSDGFFFTDPRHTDGIFIEWAAMEMVEDPRFGDPAPPMTQPPLLDVPHHAFVGAVVADPLAVAERMARLMGTPITFQAPDASPAAPMAGVSMGDCSLLLYALPGDRSMQLWGRDYTKNRTHLIGLRVDDLAAAASIVIDNGIRVVRRDEDVIVLDPSDTGGVAVALCESLPPGDPRQHGPISYPSDR